MNLILKTQFRLLILAASLLLSVSCSSKRNAKAAIERANQLLVEGKSDEAALSFRKAIQADPQNGEAHFGLGKTLFTPDKMQQSLVVLQKASELLPNQTDIKVMLGDAALTLYLATPSRPETLKDQIEKVIQDLTRLAPKVADAARFRAYLQMSEQKPEDAVATLQKALPNDPQNRKAILGLVTALLLSKQEEEASRVALEAIPNNKDYWPLYEAMIGHYGRSKDTFKKAEQFLKLRVENDPTAVAPILNLARYYRQARDSDAIVATIAPLLKDAKRFPKGHLIAAEFYAEAQAYGPAEKTLREAIKTRPEIRKDAEIQLARVIYLFNRGDEAFTLGDQLAKQYPGDVEIGLLRADLVEMAKRTDRYDATIQDLRALVDAPTRNAEVHFSLGRVLRAKGDLTAASGEFEASLKSNPSNRDALLALVAIQINEKSFIPALKHVNTLLDADPDNPQYRLLRALCLRGQGKLSEARAELTELKSAYPNFKQVQLELANLDLAEGRFKQAESSFRNLEKAGRPDMNQISGLARALASQGEVPKAIALLASARSKVPSESLDLETAEIYFLARNFDQATVFFARVDQATKLPASVLGRYAEAEQAKGNLQQAIAIARRAIAMDPQKMQRKAFLASMLTASGGRDEAIGIYKEVLKAQPSNHQVANNLAFMMAESGRDLDEAARLASVCVRERPEVDVFADTLGFVTLKQGRYDQAIGLLQGAVKKNPNEGLYRYHLGLALIGKGDRTAAKLELEQAVKLKLEPADRAEVTKLLKTSF